MTAPGWSIDSKSDFDALMREYWPGWDKVGARGKRLYENRLRDIPWPCIERALDDIKGDQQFDRLPTVNAVASVAGEAWRAWKNSHAKSDMMSRPDQDWQRMAMLSMEVKDLNGKTWIVRGEGLEGTSGFFSRSQFKPGQESKIVQQAKVAYGYPFPEVVWIQKGSQEERDFAKRVCEMAKNIGRWGHTEPLTVTPNKEGLAPFHEEAKTGTCNDAITTRLLDSQAEPHATILVSSDRPIPDEEEWASRAEEIPDDQPF